MNINGIPIALASTNKVIITSSNIQNSLSPNLRLIQNSVNNTLDFNTQIHSISSTDKEDEFSKKFAKEIFIKFRSSICDKRIDLLQFNVDNTLDHSFCGKEMFIQRDQSQKINSVDALQFGAGTEYSKEMKKNTLMKKKNESKDPINLCIGRGKTMRKYKAVKENMFEKSQYCVFIRSSSDCFEAIPVREWYKMQPEVISRLCKPEEVMDEWTKIDQKYEAVSSFYKRKYGIETEEVFTGTTKKRVDFGDDEGRDKMPRLMLDSHDRDHAPYSSDDEEKQIFRKKKNEKIVKRLRYGKQRDLEDSDVDDRQGEEVDYMSGSSSASGNLSEADKAKIYEEEDIKSDLDEEIIQAGNANIVAEPENKACKENELESIGDSDSSNDSSILSSFDEAEEMDSTVVLKQKLSSTINKSVVLPPQGKSPTPAEEFLRRHRLDKGLNSHIVQEMYKYLTRKPISKPNLFKKLISKKLLSCEDQKMFDSLLDQVNTVTHVVNGEKLFSILT